MSNILLFIASTIYALILNTPAGRRFVDDYTAVSVILGVLLVLLSLRRSVPGHHLRRVAIAFAVAGSPLVLRSTLNRARGLKNAAHPVFSA